MGTELKYIPGGFYRISDRSGFATRAWSTRKEWNNKIVALREWEGRQPQDLVKGVPDDPTVPEPRPRSSNVYLPAFANIQAAVPIGALVIQVDNIVNFTKGDLVAVGLDDGGAVSGVFLVLLAVQPANGILTLAKPMPWTAAAQNQVADWTYQPPLEQAANYPSGH
jgi:hypothetical protein